jgi:hypothetical protein
MHPDVLVAPLWAAVAVAPTDALAGSVRGYYRRDGTYVQPHYRSNPDGNPYNNYSYPGNLNPYTGQVAPGNPNTYLERSYESPTTFPSYPTFPSYLGYRRY